MQHASKARQTQDSGHEDLCPTHAGAGVRETPLLREASQSEAEEEVEEGRPKGESLHGKRVGERALALSNL